MLVTPSSTTSRAQCSTLLEAQRASPWALGRLSTDFLYPRNPNCQIGVTNSQRCPCLLNLRTVSRSSIEQCCKVLLSEAGKPADRSTGWSDSTAGASQCLLKYVADRSLFTVVRLVTSAERRLLEFLVSCVCTAVDLQQTNPFKQELRSHWATFSQDYTETTCSATL